MKTILRLAYKNILFHKKRTVFTLLCVILAVSLITITLGITSSILINAVYDDDYTWDKEERIATGNLCITFDIAAILMSCAAICTVFPISLEAKIK